MSRRMNQKGFTLIELMIVIAIIMFLAVLVVVAFQNPLAGASTKTAAAQITDQLRKVADAGTLFQTNTTSRATSLTDLTTGTNAVFSFTPQPPTQAKETTATTGTFGYYLSTQYPAGTNVTAFGGAGVDTIGGIDRITLDVCAKINEVNYGATAGATPPATYSGTRGIQCVGTAPNFSAIIPVYVQ